MDGSGNNALQHVEELLRQGEHDEARGLLIAYLKRHADSADAWWLLSQTIDDKEQQMDCLKRVLSLDPNHALARIYLDELKTPQNTSPFTIPIDDDEPELYSSAFEEPSSFSEQSYSLYDEPPQEKSSAFLPQEERMDKKEKVAKTSPTAQKKRPPAKKKGINKGVIAAVIVFFVLAIVGIVYFLNIIIKGIDSNPVVSSPIAIIETATPAPPQSLPPTWTPTFTPIPSPTPTFTTGSTNNTSILYISVIEKNP